MTSNPEPDLVVYFRTARHPTVAKSLSKQSNEKVALQYQNLTFVLRQAGFLVASRRAQDPAYLAVFVKAQPSLLSRLILSEREADRLAHIPLLSSTPPSPNQLCPADKLRILLTFITASPQDGGLAVTNELPEWDLIEDITPLHDREWNDKWIREWSTHNVGHTKFKSLTFHFGATIATYFSFLSSYTVFLYFPAFIGAAFYALSSAQEGWSYHPLYSLLLVLWGTVWVQWWSAHEKFLAVQTGHGVDSELPAELPTGDCPVPPLNTSHPCRASYREGDSWYYREFKTLFLGIPVVSSFAVVLGGLLTSIFLLEAFVSHLYSGPGAKVFPLLPTVLFALLVPNFVKLSTRFLHGMTDMENHRTRSHWESSLALKVWALNATVAYLGLFLSAFVYIPFGDDILGKVGVLLGLPESSEHMATANASSAENIMRAKLNPSRLQRQMFAYTVTNQGVNTFMEVGLPWVLRGVQVLQARFMGGSRADSNKSTSPPSSSDTKEGSMRISEQQWLSEVKEELTRPPYDVAADYSEMVMQYGYVMMFSTVWPLAPVMALVNNVIELRSDAYKISVHTRRPFSWSRVQSIRPWLKSLEILNWMGACVNGALVYLFWPGWTIEGSVGSSDELGRTPWTALPGSFEGRVDTLVRALLASLLASHAYFVLRYIVRRVMEGWVLADVQTVARKAPPKLDSSNLGQTTVADSDNDDALLVSQFWEFDEGEIEMKKKGQ